MAERSLIPAGERPRIDRSTALRWMLDALVMAADEAPHRDSEGWLRDAAASVGNALSAERRRALQ